MHLASRMTAGALLLTLALPLTPSYAATQGASCVKAGATQTTAGKKFTCVKSGKKLVWSKGVTVVKPTPSNTSTQASRKIADAEPCSVVGEKITNTEGYLECRPVSEGRLRYFQLSNTFNPITNPTSLDSLDTCKLKDQRPVKDAYYWQQYRAVAFPAIPERNFVNTGTEKIVVVGIDFIDAPGKGTPKTALEEIIRNSTEWLDWYSNKKLKWNFTTYDNWIRAPKESQELKSAEVGADAQITDVLKSEYVSAIDKVIEVEGASAIWVIYPDSIEKIYAESQNRSYWNPIPIKTGTISPAMLAIGKETFLAHRLPWLYFVHETMHGQGLMGHSPKWPYIFGIMNNEYSPSHNLNGWESLVMGWATTESLYCADLKNLSTINLTLVPIEREQSGVSTVLIKLSESRILGIESRRVDKWSPLQIPGLYGVSTYLIDLTTNNSTNVVAPTGAYQKLANVNHGLSPIRAPLIPGFENFGTYLINGVGVAGGNGTDLNVMMYLGESFSIEGVKISLVGSGNNDIIRIEKLG